MIAAMKAKTEKTDPATAWNWMAPPRRISAAARHEAIRQLFGASNRPKKSNERCTSVRIVCSAKFDGFTLCSPD